MTFGHPDILTILVEGLNPTGTQLYAEFVIRSIRRAADYFPMPERKLAEALAERLAKLSGIDDSEHLLDLGPSPTLTQKGPLPPLWALLAESDGEFGTLPPQEFLCAAVLLSFLSTPIQVASQSLKDEQLTKSIAKTIRWIRESAVVQSTLNPLFQTDNGLINKFACAATLERLNATKGTSIDRLTDERRRVLVKQLEAVVALTALTQTQVEEWLEEKREAFSESVQAESDDELFEVHGDTAQIHEYSIKQEADDESGEVDVVETSEARSDYAEDEHRFYLNGRFCESYRNNLSILEAVTIRKILTGHLKVSETKVSAALLLLQLITAEQLSRLKNWQVVDPAGLKKMGQVDSSGRFLRVIPGSSKFWFPDSVNNSGSSQQSQYAVLQLPHYLIDAFELKGRAGRPLVEDLVGVNESLQILMSELKSRVSRFGLNRLRTAFPIAVFKKDGDSRLVQILAGDGFGFSRAPLHYFATLQSVLQRTFEAAVHQLMGSDYSFPPTDDLRDKWLGSMVGRTDLSEIGKWVQQFEPTALTLGRAKDLFEIIKVLNQWVRWCALVASAALGTRSLKTIVGLSADEISLDFKGAFIGEKVLDVSDIERAKALGNFCSEQIRLLNAVYEWALRNIPQRVSSNDRHQFDSNILRSIKASLQNALHGRGPLFFAFDEKSGESVEVSDDWLRADGRDLQLPFNVFRHLLATHWSTKRRDIKNLFAQLGHSVGYTHVHGVESTQSIIAFFNEAGHEVDCLLETFGFRAPQVEFEGKDFRARTTWTKLKKQKSAFDRALKAKKVFQQNVLLSKRYSLFAKEQVDQWFEEAKIVDGQKLEVPLQQLVDGTIRKISEEKPGRVHEKRVKIAVCHAVKQILQFRELKTTTAIPHFSVVRREEAPIGAAGLAALGVVKQARKAFETFGLERDSNKNQILESFVRWALVLLFFQPFRNDNQFWSIFDAFRSAQWCDSDNSVWLRLSNEAVVRLPGWMGIFLVPIRNDAKAHSFFNKNRENYRKSLIRRINGELARWAPTFNFESFLDVGRIAARVELPGQQWAMNTQAQTTAHFHFQRASNWVLDGVGGEFVSRECPENSGFDGSHRNLPWADEKDIKSHLTRIAAAFRRKTERKLSKKSKIIGNVEAAKINRTRGAIQSELLALQEELQENPYSYPWLIEVTLQFALSLTSETARLDRAGPLAPSTAGNLLSPVRKFLVPLLIKDVPEVSDVDVWLDYYKEAMLQVPKSTYTTASNAFWRFHRVLVDVVGAEPINGADWPFGKPDEDGWDAASSGFVSEAEHTRVLSLLVHWIDQVEGVPSQYVHAEVRLLKIARIVWVLCWNLGMRGPTESCGLLHRDVENHQGELLVHVRRSKSFALKSNAAERTLNASNLIRDEDLSILVEWIETEKQAIGNEMSGRTYLFPELSGDLGTHATRKCLHYITLALRHVTNDDNARVHWGRRGFGTRLAYQSWLSPDGDVMGNTPSDQVVMIGHTVITTAQQSYIFLRDFRFGSDSVTDDAKKCAEFLGLNKDTMAKWIKRKHSLGIHPLASRAAKELPSLKRASSAGYEDIDFLVPQTELIPGVARVGQVLHGLANGQTWQQTMWRAGYSAEQMANLASGVFAVACRIPDLFHESVVLQIAQLFGLETQDYRPPPPSSTRTRRSIPELHPICQQIDNKSLEFDAVRYADAIGRALLATKSRLYTRDAYINVTSESDRQLIDEYFELVRSVDGRLFVTQNQKKDGCYRFTLSTRTQEREDGKTSEGRGVLFMMALAIPMVLARLTPHQKLVTGLS